jgi:hypothetical protein
MRVILLHGGTANRPLVQRSLAVTTPSAMADNNDDDTDKVKVVDCCGAGYSDCCPDRITVRLCQSVGTFCCALEHECQQGGYVCGPEFCHLCHQINAVQRSTTVSSRARHRIFSTEDLQSGVGRQPAFTSPPRDITCRFSRPLRLCPCVGFRKRYCAYFPCGSGDGTATAIGGGVSPLVFRSSKHCRIEAKGRLTHRVSVEVPHSVTWRAGVAVICRSYAFRFFARPSAHRSLLCR